MRSVRTIAAGGAALLVLAPSAGAASGWTTPQGFAVGRTPEIVPRAGIASDGTGAAAWKTAGGALVVTTGRARGGFGSPQIIDRAGARDWSVAAVPGGGFLVAWDDRDAIRVAVRSRSGRGIVVRRVASPGAGVLQVARDPRGGWVIVNVGVLQVRALSLDPAGRRVGPVRQLGSGSFGEARQYQAVAVDPDGRAVLAFERPDPQAIGQRMVMVSTRPHGGAFSKPVAVPTPAAEPRVAVDARGRAVVAVAPGEFCAEAYCFGAPGVASVGADGVPARPFSPALADPDRVFAPTVALIGPDRGALVFQVKPRGSSPVTPAGSVHAVAFATDGSVGALQTLTSAPAVEPAVQPLSGGRALVVWAGAHRFGAARTGPDGRFQPTGAPAGRPPEPGHIALTNRDLRTAGRYAILAWQDRALVRISVRRF